MNQKGAVTIVMTILILNIIFVISAGVSALMVSQLKTSRQSGNSVIALYAAEAGVEYILYDVRKNGRSSAFSVGVNLSNGASFLAEYDGSNTVTSIGTYNGTNRKFEATW